MPPSATRNGSRPWGKKLLNEAGELEHNWNPWVYVAYADVDLDAAVDLLLGQKAAHPKWPGTDVVAAHVMNTKHLLVHPKMRAWYLAEGKWTDYLAGRVPEYGSRKAE